MKYLNQGMFYGWKKARREKWKFEKIKNDYISEIAGASAERSKLELGSSLEDINLNSAKLRDLAIGTSLNNEMFGKSSLAGLGLGLNKISNIDKEENLEKELRRIKQREKDLENQLNFAKQDNKITQLELEKLQEEIKKAQDEKIKQEADIKALKIKEKKIDEAIEFISQTPKKHLDELKEKLNKRVSLFNALGTISLAVTALSFVGYFIALVLEMPRPVTIAQYLNNVFFIIFPAIIAFASYRQSNLKSKELEEIDTKLLNSEYLEGSLKVIQKLSTNENEQILETIDKLVNHTLNVKVSNEKEIPNEIEEI